MGLIDKFLGPPTPDKFAQMLVNGLSKAGDPREANYDSEKFQIRFLEGGRSAGVANLRNFYEEHCNLPRKERSKHLKHVIRGLLTYLKPAPDDYEDVLPDLRPIVRARSYFEFLSLQSEIEGHDPPQIPNHDIGEHLSASIVYDLPESMQSISNEQLEQWDVSYYEALEVARRNLTETEFAVARLGDHLYVSATGDNYDASRMLLTDLLEQMDVDGPMVAVVPNRDTLLITGADDPEGLSLLADLAEKALSGPRPMSAVPMILKHGEWTTWMPESNHPCYERFQLLEIKSMHGEYSEQKELLDTLHQRKAIDLFVASFSVLELKSGQIFSYCLWSKGVEAILPKTQKVMFFQEGQEGMIGGDWDHVESIVGDLLEPLPEMYPPRFQVRGFPTPQQLEEIGLFGME